MARTHQYKRVSKQLMPQEDFIEKAKITNEEFVRLIESGELKIHTVGRFAYYSLTEFKQLRKKK